MRIPRDFFARDQFEQEWIYENTWCNACDAADIGLLSPIEYEEEGHIYVEGSCARCSGKVVTELTEHQRGE